MSNQSYTKGCRDCGQQIRMSEVNGKWAAYELEGNGYHTCRQQQQQQQQKQLTVEERLARLEKAIFNNN